MPIPKSALLLLVALATPEQRVAELARAADPLADDWQAEREAATLTPQLDRLAGWLAARVAGAGRPAAWRAVIDDEAHASIEEQLAPLVARFGGAEPFQARFKTIGVEDDRTRVRVELVGRSAGAPRQYVAEWTIGWRERPPLTFPRMATLTIDAAQWLEAERTWFVDATGAALPAADSPRLAEGGAYWHGRLDAIGESALFGHNGIAVGDIDGDGREDLYVGMANGLPNLMLLRQSDGSLIDAAPAAGVDWLDDTKGVLLFDQDNDGDQDLALAMGPTVVLLRNAGGARFDRLVRMRPPQGAAPFYSLAAADYDLDGDLDLYATRYVEQGYGISVPLPFHDANNGPPNHLFRNDGEERFVDATASAGLDANNRRFSLAAGWADYDDDGDPDLYVANDFGRNNLYRNDGGRFVDVAAGLGAEDQAAGMGVSWADHDGDGDLDLHVTNMYSAAGRRVAWSERFRTGREDLEGFRRHALGNSLLENRDGRFVDIGERAGIRMGRWGWGAIFEDLDLDARPDLVVPNGFITGAAIDDL